MPNEPFLIDCHSLSKSYRRGTWALQSSEFQVVAGTRVAIVGVNGAGKTTLLNLLLGTTQPSKGEVRWFGQSIQRVLPGLYSWVAFVPEQHFFYPHWTGERIVDFVRSFHCGWDEKKESSLQRLLAIPLEKKIRTYSKGNLVRLSLLLALAQGAEVLIMDEPFAGLDPLMREEILGVITSELKDGTRTLILSSHDLFAVELLAGELWVLHQGETLFRGYLNDFLTLFRSYTLDAHCDDAISKLKPHFYVRETLSAAGRVGLHAVARSNSDVSPYLRSLNVNLIRERPVTMQDAFAACVHFHVNRQDRE